MKQRAAWELQVGPEVVQMPLQRVVDRDALTDQALAVIDQQPEIELGPIQMRGRQRVQALAQRSAGDCERVDAVGLATSTRLAPRRRHQRAVHAQNPLAALDQEALERTRDVSAILKRPHALVAQITSPAQQHRGALRTGLNRLLAEQFPKSLTRQRSCATACECPHRAGSSLRPFVLDREADTPRTRLAWGEATLLSSHAKASRTGDERHSERQPDQQRSTA